MNLAGVPPAPGKLCARGSQQVRRCQSPRSERLQSTASPRGRMGSGLEECATDARPAPMAHRPYTSRHEIRGHSSLSVCREQSSRSYGKVRVAGKVPKNIHRSWAALHSCSIRSRQHGQLKWRREAATIELCTDASYGADVEEDCKGMQAAHLFWGGALVMWRQSRQSLIATSTAEAELTWLAEGHLTGEGNESNYRGAVTFCDNQAAVQLCLFAKM